jgi:AcrR family transcriptional regulator
MARAAKNPVERRRELVDAAERLFLRRGYERTAVSDIVRSIRVAQGTFYYYFDSKAEVLEAVLEKTFSALKNTLATINARSDIDPSEKFNKMLRRLFRFNREKRELFDAVHLDGNMILHHKLEEMGHTMLIPHLLEVIEAGVADGQFHAPCPEEVTTSPV